MKENNEITKAADEIIRQKIMDLLWESPSIDANKVSAEVNSGEVILKGGIETPAEKHLSEEIAKSVEGVVSVENHLHINLGIAHALSSLASHIQGDIIKNEDEKEDEKK